MGLASGASAPAWGSGSEPSRRDKSDESDPPKRGGRVCHKPCHKPLFLFADRAAKKGGSLSSFPVPLLLARDRLVVAGKPLRGKGIDKMSAATKKCRFLPPPLYKGQKRSARPPCTAGTKNGLSRKRPLEFHCCGSLDCLHHLHAARNPRLEAVNGGSGAARLGKVFQITHPLCDSRYSAVLR